MRHRRRRRRGISKSKSNFIHVRTRSLQRLGFELTLDAEQRIIKQIQNGQGKHIERYSKNRSIWEVDINGTLCNVVYDKKFKQLITILP